MKAWTIAWKDTLIRFRDVNALLFMLAAPLLITAIIGSAFSGFFDDDGDVPITEIPFIIVDGDETESSEQLIELFTDDETLTELLATEQMDDLDAAKRRVMVGESRAVLYIPAGFGAQVQGDEEGEATTLELYVDAAASITPNIIRGILDRVSAGYSTALISVDVGVAQIVDDAAAYGPALANLETVVQAQVDEIAANRGQQRITLRQVIEGQDEETTTFTPAAFFGPSMAIFFLLFTVMEGTRSILVEDQEGTLPRLLSTPTRPSTILLGKMGGVFLTGVLQFTVLLVGSRLLFNMDWGKSPLGILLLVVAFVAAATSLGMLIAAFARDNVQANIIGSAIILLFGILGGNFTTSFNYPDWLISISKLTLNYWGLEGFSDLTWRGLGLIDILPEVGALVLFALIAFALAVWRFQKRLTR
ncbi:MAG: ABC transporter permease [Chloroflexi bacterium]|nr:ABC transporter permease [Chloroflexota bacterium]MBP8055615.1 ABC transporter permease [Chloroflexota bacterium]